MGCIVSASSSLTECRTTQRDVSLVRLLPHTLLCSLRAMAKWLFHFWGTDEGIIMGRFKLIFTFICNNFKSHCMQRYLHSHLSFGWICQCLQRDESMSGKTSEERDAALVMWTPVSVMWHRLTLVWTDLHRASSLFSPLEKHTKTHCVSVCMRKTCCFKSVNYTAFVGYSTNSSLLFIILSVQF